jgi:flagellar biosynthetic protein FliP
MARSGIVKRAIPYFLVLIAFIVAPAAFAADPTMPALLVKTQQGSTETWSVSLQVLLAMTALTLLPAILLMMTSFTRIIIVLGFLRQALGTANSPPNQVLIGLALFLTAFVMSPVLSRAWTDGVAPYMDGKATTEQALPAATKPFRTFMLDQTRDSDLQLFARISHSEGYTSKDAVPFPVVVSAFATSELKTAFQMGFLIYIPFVIIDLIVASVLMSMGMMMLSPMLVSLPFKIMLFVLVDGWALLLGTLAGSFSV